MDPNSGKKNMFNKLSKKQCLDLLEKETFSRVTVSFYKYVALENLENLRDDLYDNWKRLEVLGRIYLAEEGINAQLSVPQHNWKSFVKYVYSYSFFKDIIFNKLFLTSNSDPALPGLKIFVESQIIAKTLF